MTAPRLQQDPAEGSREIERDLARQSKNAKTTNQSHARGNGRAGREDLERLLGSADDAMIAEILALQPTLAEVEEALAWRRGEAEFLGDEHKPLRGKAARIFEILNADDEDEIYSPPA